MKKTIFVIIALVFIFVIASNSLQVKGQASQRDIASKLIRFHVIANSDSKEDQTLKLKIRDEVLKYIAPKLQHSSSIEESRKILMKENKTIQNIGEKVCRKYGYKYSVVTALSHEYFPVKTYGNITLPQGKYEAYRIIIGTGEGHNWWCVMFPPLCFVDITKGKVAYKETELEMKQVLSNKEYALIDNTDSENEIVIKFKLEELIHKIFG